MRIAIVADFDVMGGTRTYFELLAALLHKDGHELYGFVPELDSSGTELGEFMGRHFKAWRFAPRRTGILSTRQPFAAFCEWKHLLPFVIRNRPHMLFFTHGTPGQWLSSLWFPLPSVHVLHSCVLDNRPPERWTLPLYLLRLGSKKRLCTVSQYASNLIGTMWNAPSSVIYNPASHDEIAPGQRIESGDNHIVTMGHVAEYKNPYAWLSVAQRVLAHRPHVRFTWHGDGPLLERMRNLAKGLEGVSFPGRTGSPQQALAQADVYFHPSCLESHGMAVVEAMQCGLPCVVSNSGGLPESVEAGINGFVLAPDDAAGMADALCQLMDSSHLRRTMGEAGRNIAQEKFSLERWTNEIRSLVNSVVEKD